MSQKRRDPSRSREVIARIAAWRARLEKDKQMAAFADETAELVSVALQRMRRKVCTREFIDLLMRLQKSLGSSAAAEHYALESQFSGPGSIFDADYAERERVIAKQHAAIFGDVATGIKSLRLLTEGMCRIAFTRMPEIRLLREG